MSENKPLYRVMYFTQVHDFETALNSLGDYVLQEWRMVFNDPENTVFIVAIFIQIPIYRS